jgi:hypothetical protein
MKSEKNLTLLRIISIVSFILMIVVNTLAVTLPINGKTTKEVSDLYPNLFVPAPITFSIWSIIYLFLLLYVVYQTGILSKKSTTINGKINSIGGWFILSCLLNSLWIICWQFLFVKLSVLVMLMLLINLILIYLKTRVERKATLKKKIFLSAPFSIYLGWISVATIANITALLVSIKWNGFGISEQIWTIGMIGAALVLSALALMKFRDYMYSLVIFWAIMGILINHSTLLAYKYPSVIIATGLAMAIIFVLMLFTATKKERKKIKH